MIEWSLRALRKLEWEPLADGTNRLRDPSRNEWVRTQTWTRPVLEALDAGKTGPEVVAAALAHPDAPSAMRAHRFLLSLEKVGYVRVEVPAPARIGGWRVEEELGRGGVGIAYACERDGVAAVAKRPWDFLHPLEAAVASVRHEAEVLASLDSPGVVRRLDLIEHDGVPVLVRERVDGPSLTDLHDGAPASPAEARAAVEAVAAILRHLHGRGWLLIDYKSSNFVQDERTGRLRLLDVGHARPPGATRVGGTPGFMPPELAARGPATIASDVWGLGRIYAFLRSGALPALRSKSESPLDGVPDDAREAVARLCAESPQERPATVAEALALLP